MKQQAQFLKRLGELITKGYSLLQGIEFLMIHANRKQQKDLNNCLDLLKEGELLHEALEKLKFNKDILSFLYFANQHGDLNIALTESSKMVEKQFQYRERMMKMMRYPLFLLCFVALMLYMIQTSLLPQFEILLSSMNRNELPFSVWFLNLAQISKMALIAGIVMLVFCAMYYFLYFKKLTPLERIRKLISIPYVNKYFILVVSYYFSSQLSTLIKGGLSIYQAIQIFEQLPYLLLFQEDAKEMKQQLVAGENLESIIRSRKHYEMELAIVITHGQANGELARELYDYSQFSLQRLEEKLGKILVMLQPIMYSIVGIMIMVMYLILLMPMFNMMNTM